MDRNDKGYQEICQVNKSKPCTFSGPWQAIIPGEVGDSGGGCVGTLGKKYVWLYLRDGDGRCFSVSS